MSGFKSDSHFTPAEPTHPAICIPRVFKNITRRRVVAIFEKLQLGEIARVDMVSRISQDGQEFLRVFVHLKWGDSEDAQNVREALLEPNGEVKVVYDEPWFWKLRASRSSGIRTTPKRPFPYIQSMTASQPSAEVLEKKPVDIETGRDY